MDSQHSTNVYSLDKMDNYSQINGDCLLNENLVVYSSTEILIITVIVPTLMVLGLITNGAFLYVILTIKSMRTVTNRYLSCLAVADVSYLVLRNLHFLIPYVTVPMLQSEEYLGDTGCILFPLLIDVTFFVHVVMVTIVSLDRFYAVYKPQENRFRYTRKYSRGIIIVSWIFCFIIAGVFQIPSSGQLNVRPFCDDWSLHNKSDSYPKVSAECVPKSFEFSSYALVVLTFPFFLSMIANFFLYAWIIALLNRRAGTTQIAKKSNQQTRNRITIMLIATGTLFFLLLIPYEVSLLISQTVYILENYDSFVFTPGWNVWYEFTKILVIVLHIINPIIYNATNRKYREAFARAFWLHKFIYRNQAALESSYKHPSAMQTTDMTGMDSNANHEVVRLHCFDGPSCKASQDNLESSDD